jgi:hypothetical protein
MAQNLTQKLISNDRARKYTWQPIEIKSTSTDAGTAGTMSYLDLGYRIQDCERLSVSYVDHNTLQLASKTRMTINICSLLR